MWKYVSWGWQKTSCPPFWWRLKLTQMFPHETWSEWHTRWVEKDLLMVTSLWKVSLPGTACYKRASSLSVMISCASFNGMLPTFSWRVIAFQDSKLHNGNSKGSESLVGDGKKVCYGQIKACWWFTVPLRHPLTTSSATSIHFPPKAE